MALLGINVPPDMQEALNREAAAQGEIPPAYAGMWSDHSMAKTQEAPPEAEPIQDADWQPIGEVAVSIPEQPGKTAKGKTKPAADFIPNDDGPIQEDAGRKAKFVAVPEPDFDPSNLPTREIRRGTDYLDVKWRLVWFRKVYPHGSIITTPLQVGDQFAFFSAEVYWQDEQGQSHSCRGHGSETPGDFGDFIEKAETKAIGRALAHAGFGAQFLPDDLAVVDSPVDRRGSNQGDVRVPARQDAPRATNNGSRSDARPAQAATQPSGSGNAQGAEMAALQKKLVDEVRRIGASPSRMQAICYEVTGKKSARDLNAAQIRDLLDQLRDVPDTSFDPEEVFTPESAGS